MHRLVEESHNVSVWIEWAHQEVVRPSFYDASFTLQLLKELFIDTFGTPRGHPKSKPFVDRVMTFCFGDKKVRLSNVVSQ